MSTSPHGFYHPIRDHAIIGNLRSAVLVSKEGSIDWAPAPFIGSPSVFARILDSEKGGHWKIAPQGQYRASQAYLGFTNIAVTTFTTDGGECTVTDFLPIEEEKTYVPAEKDTTFKIKRKVTCTRGTCDIDMDFFPRFDYARGETALSHTGKGVLIRNGTKHGVLASLCKLTIEGDRVTARTTLSEGQSRFFIFRYNMETVPERDIREESETYHERELQKTKELWEEWIGTCDLDVCPVLEGQWQNIIKRSALVLKILFFEPVGTVAAAATTSLPEEIGGVRNWDYRYTWLRDSSFIFQAFFRLGHITEARQYIKWILDQCARLGSPERLKIMYPLYKEESLDEEVLTHLDGYRGSQPVRIGNDAHLQKQWDIYGSILDMVWDLHQYTNGHMFDENIWPLLRDMAEHVVSVWREPDEGLWEVRGGKAHFVYSKVMCWVALDRAMKLARARDLEGDIAKWEAEAEAIRAEVMKRGWNEALGAFVQSFDSKELDAAALLFPAVGFIEGADPRMRSTVQAIKKHLYCKNGLLYRYTSPDGLPGQEGAFLLASFWLVDALVLAGELEEAQMLLRTLVDKANHVGLFSEEMHPDSDAFLGNFPQAYTHIGLINSTIRLTDALAMGGMRDKVA